MTSQESTSVSNAIFSSTEERVISLLGQSLPLETVANAIGITVSRVSQISSDPKCAERISKLRYETLLQHNKRDDSYDAIEDTLLEKLRGSIPLLIRPMEIVKTIQVINMAKRRGSASEISAPQQMSPVVQLTMPTQVVQSFTTNIHNQVISAGSQELITIPSGNMQNLLKAHQSLPGNNPSIGNNPNESAQKQLLALQATGETDKSS